MTVPRTFSPGVQAFLSSVPRIPCGLLVGPACQSTMLAEINATGRSVKDVVQEWKDNNEDLWRAWLQ